MGKQQIKVQQQVPRPAGIVVKTKKYALDKQFYIKFALETSLKEFWYAWFVPLLILCIPIFVSGAFWWCFGIALLLSLLFLLFWGAQFAAVTQAEQAKIMFEKMFYELDSKNVTIKRTETEGFMIAWDKFQRADIRKDAFVLWLTRGQFFYLPFSIFAKEQDLKMVEGLINRRNLVKPLNMIPFFLRSFIKK